VIGMNLKTIKKTTKELELEVTDENETILNPITHMLLEHKDVDYAACIVDHPLSNKRRLYVRVKNGKPEEILKKAVKQLADEAKAFNTFLKDKPKTKAKSKK
jgi:DNA-directed RNA polymerase subunit L